MLHCNYTLGRYIRLRASMNQSHPSWLAVISAERDITYILEGYLEQVILIQHEIHIFIAHKITFSNFHRMKYVQLQ